MNTAPISDRTPTALSLLGSLILSLGLTLDDVSDLVLQKVAPGHGWLTGKWDIAPQVIAHLQPACNLLARTGAEAAQGHLNGLCSALAGARGVIWLLAGGTTLLTAEAISTLRAECEPDTDDRDDRAARIADVAELLPTGCRDVVLDAASLDTALARIVGMTTADVQAEMPELDKRRARRILAGAIEWPQQLDVELERRVHAAAMQLSFVRWIEDGGVAYGDADKIASLPPHLVSLAWQLWPQARFALERSSPWFQAGERV